MENKKSNQKKTTAPKHARLLTFPAPVSLPAAANINHQPPNLNATMDFGHPPTSDPEVLRHWCLKRPVNLRTRDDKFCGPDGPANLGKGAFVPPPGSVDYARATEAYIRKLAMCVLQTGDISLLTRYLAIRTSDGRIINLSYEVRPYHFVSFLIRVCACVGLCLSLCLCLCVCLC